MALIAEVIKQNTKDGKFFKCDECKKKILTEEIKFVEPADNFDILTPMATFLYVDKDGIITGGGKMAKKSLGDKLLACPHCDTVHLHGFDLWED